MARTMDELVAEMEQLGYPVTKRRVIDWAQKGLLPHPRARGRGRGQGKTYQWSQPDILRRAIDIAELLAWHRRARDLYLPLWVLGHDLPLPQVQAALCRWVDGLEAGIEAAVPMRGDRADLISDLAATTEETYREHPNAPPMPLVEAILHAGLNPGTNQWDWILDDLRDALRSGDEEAPGWPDIQSAETFIQVVREQVSLPRIREVVASASEAELLAVHADLQQVVQSARAVAAVVLAIEDAMVLRVVVHLGLWAGMIDLALRRSGRGELIDSLVQRFMTTCRSLLTDPRIQREMRALRVRSTEARERETATEPTGVRGAVKRSRDGGNRPGGVAHGRSLLHAEAGYRSRST